MNVPDSTGKGHWKYFKSNRAGPSEAAADRVALVWGKVGHAGS